MPYTPPFWAGYSPQHMREPESGVGTITLRADTFNAVLYDIARSLIHHGWNKLDLRQRARLEHEGDRPAAAPHQVRDRRARALYKPYAERYIGILEGLLENPPDETPGWHASELETSQVMAHDAAHGATWTAPPRTARRCRSGCRESFIKKDGAPDVEFEGYQYFVFPMDHGEFSRTGVIGNPMRATPEKGEEALERFADHLVEAIDEFRGSRSP